MNNIETMDAAVLNQPTEMTSNTLVSQKQPLRHNVKESLDNYFGKLGDTLVNDLYNLVLAEVEAPLLEGVMKYTNNNQSKAAIMLGLSRGTLRKKLKIYGLLD